VEPWPGTTSSAARPPRRTVRKSSQVVIAVPWPLDTAAAARQAERLTGGQDRNLGHPSAACKRRPPGVPGLVHRKRVPVPPAAATSSFRGPGLYGSPWPRRRSAGGRIDFPALPTAKMAASWSGWPGRQPERWECRGRWRPGRRRPPASCPGSARTGSRAARWRSAAADRDFAGEPPPAAAGPGSRSSGRFVAAHHDADRR